MKEVLQRWLQQVGVYVDIDLIAREIRDGLLLIKILTYYDAINIGAIKSIVRSSNNETCKNNLTQLKIWFKLLNIDFTDDIIKGIIDGNKRTCIDVLNRLFLVLENKKSLHLVAKQKERHIKKQFEKEFRVSKTKLPEIKSTKITYKHSDKLLEHRKEIEWYEKKSNYKKSARCVNYSPTIPCSTSVCNSKKDFTIGKSYLQKSLSNDVKQNKKPQKHKDDVNYVRCELNERVSDLSNSSDEDRTDGGFKNSLKKCNPTEKYCCNHKSEKDHFLPPISNAVSSASTLPLHIQRYFKQLKCAAGFPCKREHHVNTWINSLVLDNFLADIKTREEDDLRSIIAYKLLKQSSLEKEMSLKLFSILNQNAVLKQSYVDLEEHMNKLVKDPALVEKNAKTENSQTNRCEERIGDYNGLDGGSVCDLAPSYFNHDSLKYMDDDYITYYQNEKKRTIELHRRLYAEKLKSRFERHYTVCYQTLEDIIDVAIRKSEFRTAFGLEPPLYMLSDWKCLFYHVQPIFDVIDDIETLLFPDDSNYENIIVEGIRQDLLNENNLEIYLKVAEYWDFMKNNSAGNEPDTDYKGEIYTVDHESQIVLGYIVHRLLEAKYPTPLPPTPANIPKYHITALVTGISDPETVQTFKALLEKAGILVIDVNSAVTFCINKYKELLNAESFQELTVKVSSFATNNELDEITEEDEIEEEEAPPFREVETQTSDSLFEESEHKTDEEAAKLGSVLFNMLLSGTEIPTSIIVDAIIQYIMKHQSEVKGWVLVNFPTTLYQASVLEFILSSKKFPFQLEDDVILSDSECASYVLGKDVIREVGSTFSEMEVKSSRIVPNTTKYKKDDTFKTYLSAYVTCVKGKISSGSDNAVDHSNGSSDSDSTILLEHPEKEGVPTVQVFYRNQGIAHDLIYETFDLNTLKRLALIVIEPYFEDLNIQEDLFTELEPSVRYRWFGSGGSKGTDEISQALIKHQSTHDFDDDPTVGSETSYIDHSGQGNKHEEPNWNFCSLPLLDNIKFALASLWEALESTYINNFKCITFFRRNNDYGILPYLVTSMTIIKEYLDQEDDRQSIVTDFLKSYNEIHQVLRSDIEMKIELHLRVSELKNQLTHLCEIKRDEAVDLLREFVNQNWAYQEMVAYTNYFISLLQTETDRCTRTLSLLKDYYLSMLGIYSSEQLQKIDVPKMQNCTVEIVEHEAEDDESEIESVEYRIQLDNKDPLYLSVIERLLNYKEIESNFTPSPMYKFFEKKTNAVVDEVLLSKSKVDNIILKEEGKVIKVPSKKDVQKAKKKKQPVTQSAGSSETHSTSRTPGGDDEQNMSQMENMFAEWKLAVKNEVDRFQFRAELIKKSVQRELDELENLVGGRIADFQDDANRKFSEECDCIGKLCNLFQVAIEERIPIRAQLIFRRNKFFTVKDTEVIQLPPVKLPPALEEMLQEESFAIKQLEAIKNRLMYIAPDGVITQEGFIEFMESAIHCRSNQENVRWVPNIWASLTHKELAQLFQRVFGNYSLIEWKEFFIHCLDLPYPITEDIIDAKFQFLQYDTSKTEVVSYTDYMKTTLWFQRELPENPLHALRNVLAKEFLFSLFRINSDSINYTSLLLAFCKDQDPKIGLGKCLSLLMGRCVIVYEEDLYLENIATDHINTELKVVTAILNEIIDDVVNCSVITTEEMLTGLPENDANLTFDQDISDNALTESMYHQFFRRHLVLRWTSSVPIAVFLNSISFSFYALFRVGHEFLRPDIIEEVRRQVVMNLNLSYDVYVPDTVNSWWLEHLLEAGNKFKAFSINNVIKEIIQERYNKKDEQDSRN